MKLSDKISMAYKDLINRKGRTLLTVIAVAIGALLLILLLGVGDGIINKMQEMVASFGDINVVYVYNMDGEKVDPMGGMTGDNSQDVQLKEVDGEDTAENQKDKSQNENFKKITDSDLKDIANVDGVEKIYVATKGKATSYKVDNKDYIDRSINVIAENTEYDKDHGDLLVCGNEINNKDDDILIGENLIKKLGFDDKEDIIGKKVTVKVEMPKIEGMEGLQVKEPVEVTGTVKGVLDRKEYMDCIVMDQDKAKAILSYYEQDTDDVIAKNGYSIVKAFNKDNVKGTDLSTKIKDETGYMCVSYSMFSDIFVAMGSIVKAILSIGGIIVLIVAGLGLVNTITMILQEKRKMIGVMRSVGGSRSNIRSVFLLQSIMIGVAGCVLGAVLSTIAILISNNFITNSSGFAMSISAYNMGIALVITFIIALLSGLIPAGRAAKLNVVQAVAEE